VKVTHKNRPYFLLEKWRHVFFGVQSSFRFKESWRHGSSKKGVSFPVVSFSLFICTGKSAFELS
jgi:hypothetical protein